MRVEIAYKGRKVNTYNSAELTHQPLVMLAYQRILEALKSDLAEWLSVPNIIPLAMHVNYKCEIHGEPSIHYIIGNGGLSSKMSNLVRNKSVVLHYAFYIKDETSEVATGLFKIKVLLDKGLGHISAAQSA